MDTFDIWRSFNSYNWVSCATVSMIAYFMTTLSDGSQLPGKKPLVTYMTV